MGYLHRNNTNDLLTLVDVSLDYGQFRALKNIHFSLGYAEIHAIVGEHGAGKSSLAMIISGALKPQSGYIMFDEREYRSLTLKMAGVPSVRPASAPIVTWSANLKKIFPSKEPLFIETLEQMG